MPEPLVKQDGTEKNDCKRNQQLCCTWFQAVWAKWGSKRLLWERIRAVFFDDALESMRQ